MGRWRVGIWASGYGMVEQLKILIQLKKLPAPQNPHIGTRWGSGPLGGGWVGGCKSVGGWWGGEGRVVGREDGEGGSVCRWVGEGVVVALC